MMAEINGLKRRLQESPDDDQVLLRLANLYYDAAMWERAAGYYERVAKLIPDDPDLLTDLGVCYKELRRYDDALASFDRAHGLDATHWQSLYNTVVVAGFDLNQIDVALRALELIESIDPQPAELSQGRMERLREMVQGLASTAREPT
jgi:tetratricopeptide (TPR) repeat protein